MIILQNEVILQNGTLLITEVSLMSAGNYQCSGYYNNVLFNGTSFNVSVTEGMYDILNMNEYRRSCYIQ